MSGYYGDKKVHTCKECGFKGKDTEFNPITRPDTMEDGTETIIVGFQCKCGYEWFETEVKVNENQQRLNFKG